MPNRVPLDNVEHADLRVAVRHGPEHGDGVNQTLVVPSEFEDAQREYPIFLRKDAEGTFVAVAILGFDRSENLFVSDGFWDARYLPAVHRRGPFFLGVREQQELGERRREIAVHIDLEDPRVGTAEGQPLFKEHGGNTPYLDHVTQALHQIHEGLSTAPAFYAMLEELGLIQPVEVEAQLGDDASYKIPGLFTIGMDQLQSLSGESLKKLNAGGYLAPAIFIRSSLPNMNRLIDLKKRKMAGEQQAG